MQREESHDLRSGRRASLRGEAILRSRSLFMAAALATLGGTCASRSFAQDGEFYVTPKLGYLWTDSSRVTDDGLYYGGALGLRLAPAWSAEINVLTGSYDGRRGAPDLRLTAISLDALREFAPGATVSPYLTAGLGVLVADPSYGGSEESFLLQGGVGARIAVWRSAGGTSFSLVPEVKVRWDTSDTYRRPVDFLAGVGFQIAFGGPHAEPVALAPPPPPPAPTPPRVEQVPPPAPPPPVAVEPPPPPPPAAPVLRGAITLEGVRFETASAKLIGDSHVVLDKVAASLKAYPRLRVEVQGHTDSVGAADYNLKLSQARAESVSEYLVSQGVSPAQLTAHGYGLTQPVADNKTATGRARNRRVVLSVLSNPDDVEVRDRGGDR